MVFVISNMNQRRLVLFGQTFRKCARVMCKDVMNKMEERGEKEREEREKERKRERGSEERKKERR
jgi:hypothetical protein